MDRIRVFCIVPEFACIGTDDQGSEANRMPEMGQHSAEVVEPGFEVLDDFFGKGRRGRVGLWNQRNSVGYAGFPVSFVGAGTRVLLSRGRLGAPSISARISEGIISSSVRVDLGLVESL